MSTPVQMGFGKDAEGNLIHIKDASNGLSCGCQCIECGAPLVAKQGKILDWHFAHAADSSCQGYNPETLLHYRAKHMFAEIAKRDGLHSLLPQELFYVEEYSDHDDHDRLHLDLIAPLGIHITSWYGVNVLRELIPDRNCHVRVEGRSPCKLYQPDIAVYPFPVWLEDRGSPCPHGGVTYLTHAYAKGKAYYTNKRYWAEGESCLGPRRAFVGVEVVVTHDVDHTKLNKIKDANDVSIRIDLSSCPRACTDTELESKIKANTSIISYGEGHFNPRAIHDMGLDESELEDLLEDKLGKWLCSDGVYLDQIDEQGVFVFVDFC